MGGMWRICMYCHGDFTQLNLYSSLCDGAELEERKEGEERGPDEPEQL